ncbi:MAG: ATP-binding protein [Pseudomonadota bacterium]
MRWTIGKRIFAAVTVMAVVIVGLTAVATRLSFDRSFAGYLDSQQSQRLETITARLIATYEADGGWQKLSMERRRWDGLFRPGPGTSPGFGQGSPPGAPAGPGGRDRKPPPPSDPLELLDRVTLTDANGYQIAGRFPVHDDVRSVPIEVGNDVVGYLNIARTTRLTDAIDIRFAAEQQRSIVYIAIAALMVGAAVAVLLARQIMAPVIALKDGTTALANGDFDRRITVVRDDELGDLAEDFNSLAKTLERSRQSRQQWVSDIAHELRTPLSILNGELQAVEDGIRSFDESTLRSLLAEVDRLSRLVNDLHDLTRSDEGGMVVRREPIDVFAVVGASVENLRARVEAAQLVLNVDLPTEAARILGDETKLEQLVTNLIENALRYTDSPGQLRVSGKQGDDGVTLCFDDTPPSVSDIDRERLFDRLFRVEGSRNRAAGGSGLGLSICEAIVTAHDGHIEANPSELGGLQIVVVLPVAES